MAQRLACERATKADLDALEANVERTRGMSTEGRYLDSKGKPSRGHESFIFGRMDGGFWNGMGGNGQPARGWGRPVGLAVAKDGSLLIADDVGNVVWRVTYTGK